MRSILTLSLLMLASIHLQAQSLNAGLRANASYRMRPEYNAHSKLEAAEGDHLNIAPEVFVRYALKKRWAFEASFNRSQYRPPDIFGKYYEQGQPYDTAALKYKADYSELSFSAFYELRCPSLQKNSFLRNLHSYAGVSVGILFSKFESAYYFEGGWGCFGGWSPSRYTQYEGLEKSVWTGVNYNVTFDLGKRIKLVSSSYFKFRPGRMLSASPAWDPYAVDAQFGLQLGAAYRIF